MKPIEVLCSGDTADVLIYDQIGNSWMSEGLTAKSFAEQLKAAGKGIKTINVRLNSPGGSVFEGAAIYNTLINHGAKVRVHIDGAALSVASIIAMAGEEINMAANGFMMIHDPVSRVAGGAEDMRKSAEMLDKIKATLVDTYAKRTGQPAEDIARMMSDETWMDAADAKRLGFITNVTEKVAIAASFEPSEFKNAPDRFRDLLNQIPEKTEAKTMPEAKPEDNTPKAANYEEIVAACEGADPDFIVKQLAAKATAGQAGKAWLAEMKTRLDASQKALADAQAKSQQKPGADPLSGNPPQNSGAGAGGSSLEQWNSLVDAKVKGGMPKAKAVSAVNRENPGLREAMVAEANAQ